MAIFFVLAIMVSPKMGSNYLSAPILNGDRAVFLYVNNYHYTLLNQFMIISSQFGRELFWAIAILILFIFGKGAGKRTAIIMALTIIIIFSVGVVTKEIVARPRPIVPSSDFLLATDSEFSFPSGHALVVSAGAAIALTLFRNSPKNKIISLALAIEAAIVCYSRVYVGGHYPLDVIGGILLGVGISFIIIGAVNKWEESLLSVFNRNRRGA